MYMHSTCSPPWPVHVLHTCSIHVAYMFMYIFTPVGRARAACRVPLSVPRTTRQVRYFELYVAFSRLDVSGDRRLDFSEFEAALPAFRRWGIEVRSRGDMPSLPQHASSCLAKSCLAHARRCAPMRVCLVDAWPLGPRLVSGLWDWWTS